ncbi:MAG: hypothetical protein K2Q01_05950, partial [Rickettsiales bacterium]|nr:hypothetical protein [Rickettsiales bacterium]
MRNLIIPTTQFERAVPQPKTRWETASLDASCQQDAAALLGQRTEMKALADMVRDKGELGEGFAKRIDKAA